MINRELQGGIALARISLNCLPFVVIVLPASHLPDSTTLLILC